MHVTNAGLTAVAEETEIHPKHLQKWPQFEVLLYDCIVIRVTLFSVLSSNSYCGLNIRIKEKCSYGILILFDECFVQSDNETETN